MNVGIVGLGLIGGSMAKSTKARTGQTVWGADLDKETMTMARMCGAIDAPLTDENLPQCDLILVAIRPAAAVEWVRTHASLIAPSAILVDLCGVKRTVVSAITPIARERGFAYIGGHPMAGRERGGFTASSEDLYVGASMILTPPPGTDIRTLSDLKHFFRGLGFGRVVMTTPEEHDRMIAFTSQLPHVLACAYVMSPQCPNHKGYSAGSYRDVSRVARINETLWSELFLENREPLTAELDTLIENLTAIRNQISGGNQEKLKALLRKGRKIKEALGE